jgi:hypothetical protein
MPLADIHIRNLKPEPGKKLRLFDAGGLYLEVSPTGGTYWRWKYHFGGKERRLAIGVYPEVSLKEACLLRDEVRKLLSTGVDPVRQRKKDRLLQLQRSGETFKKIGREWYGKQAEIWSPDHAKRILSRLERDLFPFLGDTIAQLPNLRLLKLSLSSVVWKREVCARQFTALSRIARRYSISPLPPESAK